VRDFISKSIAGGLSAGVVLLWWPALFAEVDTVTSWFVRGVAWTVCFELLLVALIPFERALWETTRGERITRTVGSAGLRLHSGSPRRRMSRLSAVATGALAIPVALLVAGLHNQAPSNADAASTRPIKVVRVTKVVRPVTVKKIVEQTPVQQTYAPAAQQTTPAPVAPRTTEKPKEDRTVLGNTAPVQSETAPTDQDEAAPDTAPR
jgi:hypothetical protein